MLEVVDDEISDTDRFEAPYYDYLQSPLQPLMDNLESQTYEVFELDPVKYQRYEDAIAGALVDTPEDKVSVVMVVRMCAHLVWCMFCWPDGCPPILRANVDGCVYDMDP